ncbi:MAG: hypothetical protein H2069_00560 [Legionella sp.]|nr:hypothetical protein [Legionella sp.]
MSHKQTSSSFSTKKILFTLLALSSIAILGNFSLNERLTTTRASALRNPHKEKDENFLSPLENDPVDLDPSLLNEVDLDSREGEVLDLDDQSTFSSSFNEVTQQATAVSANLTPEQYETIQKICVGEGLDFTMQNKPDLPVTLNKNNQMSPASCSSSKNKNKDICKRQQEIMRSYFKSAERLKEKQMIAFARKDLEEAFYLFEMQLSRLIATLPPKKQEQLGLISNTLRTQKFITLMAEMLDTLSFGNCGEHTAFSLRELIRFQFKNNVYFPIDQIFLSHPDLAKLAQNDPYIVTDHTHAELLVKNEKGIEKRLKCDPWAKSLSESIETTEKHWPHVDKLRVAADPNELSAFALQFYCKNLPRDLINLKSLSNEQNDKTNDQEKSSSVHQNHPCYPTLFKKSQRRDFNSFAENSDSSDIADSNFSDSSDLEDDYYAKAI